MSGRKKFTPKWGRSPNNLFVAIQGSRLLSKDDQAAEALRLQLAFEEIAKGQGGKEQWQQMFDAMNMIEEWSRVPKIMRGAHDFVMSTQAAIVGILDRQKESGSKALYAHELQALCDLVGVWTDCLSVVTHADYFKAQERVAKRLQAILRSKTPGVRVVEVV